MKLKAILLLPALMVVLVACGGGGLSEADIEATVEARVEERLAAIPTATPPYWPTPEDFKIVVNSKTATYGGLRAELLNYFDEYAAVYVASECLANRKLTPKGFRSFVDQTLGMKTADGTEVIAVTAEGVIEDMIFLAEDRMRLGLSSVDRDCMRPYMYPETGAEAALVVGPAMAILMANLIPFLRDVGVQGIVEDAVFLWFDPDVSQGKPLLPWYCGQNVDNCRLRGDIIGY